MPSIEELIEIYKGDYAPAKQYAASIMLKMLLKSKYAETMDEVRESLGFRINDRNSSKVLMWKKKVKKVGKCDICGSTENLEAHHIIPWEYSITGRTDINNGQCLCKKCHSMIHDDNEWYEYLRGKYNG